MIRCPAYRDFSVYNIELRERRTFASGHLPSNPTPTLSWGADVLGGFFGGMCPGGGQMSVCCVVD